MQTPRKGPPTPVPSRAIINRVTTQYLVYCADRTVPDQSTLLNAPALD